MEAAPSLWRGLAIINTNPPSICFDLLPLFCVSFHFLSFFSMFLSLHFLSSPTIIHSCSLHFPFLVFSFPSNSFHFLNFPAVMCSCSFIVLSLFVHFLSLFFIPFHILPFLFNSFQLLLFPFTFYNSGSPNKF